MTTIMEKDILIEAVSGVLATIAKRLPVGNPYNQDQLKTAKIRSFIYQTDPEQLDYDAILNECKKIQNKYIELPILD